VVAEEVGKLARLSGTAAEEIRSLVDQGLQKVNDIASEINLKVDSGVKLTQECVNAFEGIQKRTDSLTNMVLTIQGAAQEQEIGVTKTKIANQNIESSTDVGREVSERTKSLSHAIRKEYEVLEQASSKLEGLIRFSQGWIAEGYNRKSKRHMTEIKPGGGPEASRLGTPDAFESVESASVSQVVEIKRDSA
jgi:methyl-accepting chemotaxis protein